MVEFGTINKDGIGTKICSMDQSIFANCPFCIFDPSHYRQDRTCKCLDETTRR